MSKTENVVSPVELALVGGGAVVLSGAIFPWMKLNTGFAIGSPDLLFKLSMLGVGLLSLQSISRRFESACQMLARSPLLIALVLWMAGSLFWTIAPGNRIQVAAGLLVATTYALFLSLVIRQRAVIEVLGLVAAAVLAASLIERPFFADERRLWGIYANKNLLARVAAFSAVLGVFLLLTARGQDGRIWPPAGWVARAKNLAWLFLAVAGVFISTTYFVFTAQLALAASTLAACLIWGLRNGAKATSAVVVVILVIIGLAVVFAPEIAKTIRKTSSLNNRLFHWQLMLHQDLVSPWRGAGLGGFWDRTEGAWKNLPLRAPLRHAHNGFIETWLDLGLVGVVMMGSAAATAIKRSWPAMISPAPLATLGAGTAAGLLAYNLTESSILPTTSANLLFWALFIVLCLACAVDRGVSENRRARVKRIVLFDGAIDLSWPIGESFRSEDL